MPFFHGKLFITVGAARDLDDVDTFGKNDCFCDFRVGMLKLAKTKTVDNTNDPVFDESFIVDVASEADSVTVTLRDEDVDGSDNAGRHQIPYEKLEGGDEISEWLPLDPQGEIHVTIRYEAASFEPIGHEVPDVYFGTHDNCKVTLYQDAHVPEGLLGEVLTEDGVYENGTAWKDLAASIEKAEKFIYITGWAVFTEITLIRDDGEEHPTLGELLKAKAEAGVKVLIMIWNEYMSNKEGFTAMIGLGEGLMGTHDEETKEYFEGTGVIVASVGRALEHGQFFKSNAVAINFTHHQKSVILDQPMDDDNKNVIAYVGGLDLTNGRYDTPNHDLFRTLQGAHAKDFWQGCDGSGSMNVGTGCREPWHDIHCKLQGGVARDVMKNFEERWIEQAGDLREHLVDLNEMSEIVSAEDENAAEGQGEWKVQLFRSIDDSGATFTEGSDGRLHHYKGRAVDKSIQTAYVHHIRAAKRFIYIENQYFLGSSHAWENPLDGCLNLIPLELCLKICDKIRKGEDFRVYVLTPMYPEGPCESAAVQEILQWENRTMKMMYKRIAECMAECEVQGNPRDYLTFFCLGNRETEDNSQHAADGESRAATIQQTRRFVIYVHSKMMIVDDEYIIIGSANINERSMNGARDSEIAMGAYQPNYVDEERCPKGNVHGFRTSLWAEHIGEPEGLFNAPETLDCMQRVNEIVQENWEKYIGDEVVEMDHHMMPFPIVVADDGSLTPLCEVVPDFEGLTCGDAGGLPNILTF